MSAVLPLALALDCSTARGSVALGECGGRVLWRAEFTAGRGCGGKLFTALAEALRVLAELERGRLGEIVVGLGPGSYSGVRQAIAAATGLSVARGVPLVGLPSPLALETAATAYHAVGDARRGTFYYTAVVSRVCLTGPELLDNRDALAARLAERPAWPVLTVECALDGEPSAPATPTLPLAEYLLAAPASTRPEFPLEPFYLRPPNITLPSGPRQPPPPLA